MELIGLLFAAPVALFASVIFCLLVTKWFKESPSLQHICGWISGIIFGTLIIELIVCWWFGPLVLDKHLGRIYGILHLTNLLLGPPAVACIIILRLPAPGIRRIVLQVVAIVACWITCMAVLLGNIVVDEAINGIGNSYLNRNE